MSAAAAPELSVILAALAGYRPVRGAIRNLVRQERDARIELLLVKTTASEWTLDDRDRRELESFTAVRVIDVPPGSDFDSARAAAVREASAPFVAFTEDHSFPQAGWAAALLERLEEGWTGVGPVVENGNPRTSTSWANFLMEYGPWMPPGRAGAWAHIPGHNSAYRREALTALGAELATYLEVESVIHWTLGQRGHRFTIEPRARTRHVNFSKPWPSIALRFHGSRQFASRRARGWSLSRRALYAAGTSVLPALRLSRLARLPFVAQQPSIAIRALPAVLASVVVSSLGECVGYVTSDPGASMRYLTNIENDRTRFLARSDRATVA
jgi:hypothetical protein